MIFIITRLNDEKEFRFVEVPTKDGKQDAEEDDNNTTPPDDNGGGDVNGGGGF